MSGINTRAGDTRRYKSFVSFHRNILPETNDVTLRRRTLIPLYFRKNEMNDVKISSVVIIVAITGVNVLPLSFLITLITICN